MTGTACVEAGSATDVPVEAASVTVAAVVALTASARSVTPGATTDGGISGKPCGAGFARQQVPMTARASIKVLSLFILELGASVFWLGD